MAEQKKRMIFLINSPILLGIFDSEALTFLRWVRKNGYITDMILFVDPDWREKGDYRIKLDQIREDLGEGKLATIDRPSIYKGFSAFEQALYPALEELIGDEPGPRIIHCMGYLLTCIALEAKKNRFPGLRVHADLRGILPQECLYYEEGFLPLRIFRYFLARGMERKIMSKADSISCVSKAFKRYLLKKYRIPEEKIIVVPLCIDMDTFYFSPELRTARRHQLGWQDSVVILYSGKRQRWQLPKRLIKNMILMTDRIKASRAVILTRVPEAFQVDIDGLSPEIRERFEIHCVPHDEVAQYLMAADIGLLFRKKDLVNRVACPTKFAEYVGCGLPVLCTHGIGDISAMIRENQMGWIIDDPYSKREMEIAITEIQNTSGRFFSAETRRNRSHAARKYFSWKTEIQTVMDRYESLMES